MKQKTIKLLMLAGTMILANTMLTSCSDDDSSSSSSTNIGAFNYQSLISCGGMQTVMMLDSLSSEVKTVTSSQDWITVSPAVSADGRPCVNLKVEEYTGDKDRKGSFVATDADGNVATVTITQGTKCLSDLDTGGNAEDWFTNWDQFKTIKLAGMTDPVNTPWNNPQTDAHSSITHVTKAQGWEMAFSYMNNPAEPDRRYFALYNRYLGILRVFCYVPTGQVPDGEPYFEVQLGSASPSSNKTYYPYYNSIGYSIPTNKNASNIDFNADLTGMGTTTFHFLVSPYTRSVTKTVSVGWNVFDINMHGYVPEGARWRDQPNDGECLYVKLVSKSNVTADFYGSFSGVLDGTYIAPEIKQHGGISSAEGICSTLNMIGQVAGAIKGGGASDYAMKTHARNQFNASGAASTFDKAFMGAQTACMVVGIATTVASAIYKATEVVTPEWYDTIPGKISMNMNGVINLQGKLSEWKGNSSASVTVEKRQLESMNKEGHFGEGVIGLAEEPVIVVAKEDIMGDVDKCFFDIQGNKYENSDVENYALRLISFLDPTSIKLNLNTKLFDDLGGITDIVITPTWGVIPKAKHGYTDAMRRAISMEARPTISLAGSKTSGTLTLNSISDIRLHKVLTTELMNTEIDDADTQDNCQIAQQTGSDIRYYGRTWVKGGKELIPQPQIFVPYKDGYAYDIEVPDIIVGLHICVNVKNANPTADNPQDCFVYSLQYIPKIKLVSRAELKSYYEKLKDCQSRWQPKDSMDDEPAGYLENNKSVPFYMPLFCMQKTLDMLKKVTE